MKRILIIALSSAIIGFGFFSCKSQEKRGLTKEQRERIDQDKEEFEDELEDDEEKD